MKEGAAEANDQKDPPQPQPDPERTDDKEPHPGKGEGRRGNVQQPPSEQRGKPDPKQR